MKKIALILSALFICALLSGCGKSEITPLSELYQGQITMNGVSYSVPFTLDELDENYTVTTSADSKNALHEIKYKGNFYALATSSDVENMTVSDINFAEDSGFSFGKVKYGSTKKKIEEAHGSADYEVAIVDNEMAYYYLNENAVFSIIYKNDKVIFISFNFDGSMRAIIEDAQNSTETE